MATRIGHSRTTKRGVGRGLAGVVLASAALCGLAIVPAAANPYVEPRVERPRVVVPRSQVTTFEHRNLAPLSVIQRTALANVMASVSGSRRADVSPMKRKEDLERRKKELEKKKKEEEKKLAKLKKEFLDSKEGKDAKQKIDKERKKRDKKIGDAIRERNMNQSENCCGSTDRGKWTEWLQKKMEEAWDDFNKAEKTIFEDEFKKKNPKKFKEYEKAKNERKNTGKKIKQVDRELDDLNGPPSRANVQP